MVVSRSTSVVLGPFQLINLTPDFLLLPVTAAFTLRLVSKVWQADKQPQFSNFALIQPGVGGKGELGLLKCFAQQEAGQGQRLCRAQGTEELGVRCFVFAFSSTQNKAHDLPGTTSDRSPMARSEATLCVCTGVNLASLIVPLPKIITLNS